MAVTLRNMPLQLKLTIVGAAALVLLVQLFLCWRWSREPPLFLEAVVVDEAPAVTGYLTVETLIQTIDWLLEKPGGYLSNDVYPLSWWLDNMPHFEFGVLVQSQDLSRILRTAYSRSPAQTEEHPALVAAERAINSSHDKWVYPSTQRKLREAEDALIVYRSQLVDREVSDAQFYTRADNLSEWLAIVERRLSELSLMLSASVGQTEMNANPAGEASADNLNQRQRAVLVKTPWTELDRVFFEARGSAWALLQFMAAAQVDFDGVLAEKNAVVSLEQVMRELEGALNPIRSPIILNGGGYGFFANHSLVLASYISRAHSAVSDVRALLAQG